jgi:hypothetical protein
MNVRLQHTVVTNSINRGTGTRRELGEPVQLVVLDTGIQSWREKKKEGERALRLKTNIQVCASQHRPVGPICKSAEKSRLGP